MDNSVKIDDMEIPFIHLLKSPNGKYFYDVNTNDIVSVSDKTYYALMNLLNRHGDILEQGDKDEIEKIKANGFLSSNKVKEIKHPAYDYIETFLERKLQKITLQVTQSCNLRCSYCVYSEVNNEKQRSHSAQFMSFETAKKAVDFLLEHSIDSDHVNISFYGGEPLLAFHLIQEVISYAEDVFLGKDIKFNLTTNCTLLNDEIVEYFVKHNVHMMISIDGPAEIHNSNRRFAADGTGSFEVILDKLESIRQKYPEFIDKVHISMVIDPQNDYDCINSLFIDYNIFKKMNVHSSIIDDIYTMKKNVYSDDYIEKQNYQIFLAYLAYFGRLDYNLVSNIAWQEIQYIENKMSNMGHMLKLSDVTAPSGPCIPGQLRLFIDVKGNFFPCERVNENSELMKIGNIEEGFHYDKAANLLNFASLTSEECRNCWAITHCNLCAKNADDGGKFNREFKLSHCKSVRENFHNTLLDIIFIKEFYKYYN